MPRSVVLASETDFEGWRNAARALVLANVPPGAVHWSVATGQPGRPCEEGAAPSPIAARKPVFTVPRRFLRVAARIVLHRDADRFALLYRLLWRLRDEPRLLDVAADADVAQARTLFESVARDLHRMKAELRFRRIEFEGGGWSIAWFEPEHRIAAAVAPSFARRFAAMRWSILTPEQGVHWDGRELSLTGPVTRDEVPDDDALESLWRRDFASLFVEAPASVDRSGSREAAMPVLSEEGAVATAHGQVVPRELASLEALREQAAECRNCDLWKPATQVVFGEGRPGSPLMMVGEQPGDREDLTGRPFVGPAGKLLDRALTMAGIERESVYVTNAVKHFKYVIRGERRLHQTPKVTEIRACRPWLAGELERVRPKVVLALGATAAQSVTGRVTPIGPNRGRVLEIEGRALFITVHPSYLLRVPEQQKEPEFRRFVDDLKRVARYLAADAG